MSFDKKPGQGSSRLLRGVHASTALDPGKRTKVQSAAQSMPVAAARQADADFARDGGVSAKVVSDLDAPRADHDAYESEMIKDLEGSTKGEPSAQLDAVVRDAPDVATTAIYQAEMSGAIDPAVVSHAASAHGLSGNWTSVEAKTEDRAQADINVAMQTCQQAKSDYDDAKQRMLLELYQLSPTLTDKQMAAYEDQFWKQSDNAAIVSRYKDATAKLASMMTRVGGILGEAAKRGDAVGTNARYTQFLAFQAFVEARNLEGCRAAHGWAADLGKRAKAGEPGCVDEIKQINVDHPDGLKTIADGAVTVLGSTELKREIKAAAAKGAPQPSLRARWDDIHDTYLAPLNDLAQILGLGELRELRTKVDEIFDMIDAQAKGREAVDELLLQRKLDEALHVAPLGTQLLTLFVEAFGTTGTIAFATSGAIDAALVDFASNGGKVALADAVSRWRDLCGMITEVHEPTLIAKLLPGISVAANVLQLRLDMAEKDDPAHGLKLVGDIIAISGSLLEFIPYFQFGGEAIEAVGLAINALGDLIDHAFELVHGSGPSQTQTDERAILATPKLAESSNFIAAHTTDPDRSGKNLRALESILSPGELTELANANPALFNADDLDAAVIAANVKTLRAARVPMPTIKQLCMTAANILTTRDGARNLAVVLEQFPVMSVPLVIESMPELVSEGGLTVSARVVADNLAFLRLQDVAGVTDASIIKVIGPPMILRPGGAAAMFHLWVALYQSFVTHVTFLGLISTLMNEDPAQIDQAITWALANNSPNIDSKTAIKHFYYDTDQIPGGYYLTGVWFDFGLFPPRDMKKAMGEVR